VDVLAEQLAGEEEGEEIMLTVPENPGDYPLKLLPSEQKVALLKELEAEKEKRNAEARDRAKALGEQNIQLQESGGDFFIIF
jgi:hypothetical protein